MTIRCTPANVMMISIATTLVASLGGTAVRAEMPQAPPLGLFDYLGSMVENDGLLIDPLELEGDAVPLDDFGVQQATIHCDVSEQPNNEDRCATAPTATDPAATAPEAEVPHAP